MREFHTIPVPLGWSIEQAWEAISRDVELEHPWGEPYWAGVETKDGRLIRVLPMEGEQ